MFFSQVRRLNAGHHVDAGAIQGRCIGQRQLKALAKFGLSAWQTGKAAFTRLPVARWGIEQHLLQAVVLQALLEFMGWMCIRKEGFDRLEAIFCGRLKAVQKRQLVVEHRQIGRELGHKKARRNEGLS